MKTQENKASLTDRISKLEQENRELQKKLSVSVSHQVLEERIRFEKAIFRISSFFIGEYNLDKAIHKSFELLGTLAEADRVYLYRMHQKKKLVHVTHESIISDPNLIERPNATFSSDRHPWLIEQLQTQEIIYIDDTASLPDRAVKEKETLTSQGVKSVVIYPLRINGDLEGFIGFDHITTHKKWERQDLEAFKVTADIIGFSIERKRSEKSLRKTEQMYEKIFEHTGAATLMLKPDTTIIMVNSEFERLTGYPRNEVEGNMKLLNLIDRKDRSVIQKYLLLLISNPEAAPRHYEFNYLTSDAELRSAYMTGSTLINSKTSVISFIDITEFKETERQLVIAKEKAEESDRLKSSFFANVSHEIRTPLNAITGFSALLSSPNLPLAKKEKYTRQILNSSNELVNLIDNVLDISRIESGSLKPRFTEFFVNIQLRELQDLFEDLKLQHGKGNLEIKLSLPPGNDSFLIRTDQYRFQQILTNLIENAVKFTSSGTIEFGYSSLTGPAADNEVENILFFVRDTGIGIAKKNKERIFERFGKIVDRSDHLYRGAGLGLALCRDLVHMLSGEIWVESSLGKGSTFYFTLPFSKPVRQDKGRKTTDKKKWDFTGKTIIIAEDTESNYLYLKEILANLNTTILRAKDGREAVDLYRKNKDQVNLILMDILMPEYDGFEAAQRIRDIRKDVVIIAQTAFAFEGEMEHDLYAGCFDDYILKPFDIKSIRDLMIKYLSEEDPQ